MDEFALIRRYFDRPTKDESVRLGIGDDAALIETDSDRELLCAVDTIVAGVHYPEDLPPFDVGYRAVAVNVLVPVHGTKSLCEVQAELESKIAELADRPPSQLDPVELAILLLGFFELGERADVPYRVVINESINLAKRFGAVDGHKYINAVLDKAADKLRPEEACNTAK